MKYFSIFLTIAFTSKCWGIPTKSEKQVDENLKQIFDPLDYQLAEAIRSLDMATVALKNDPTYMGLENMLKDSLKTIKEEEKHILKPENSDNIQVFNPGFDIEYDTSRIILKHKKQNSVHIQKRKINPGNVFEHVSIEPHTLHGKVENFSEQKDRLVAQPQNLMSMQEQERHMEHEEEERHMQQEQDRHMQEEQEKHIQEERNMQQEGEHEHEQQEKMVTESSLPFAQKVPFVKHCAIKCDNKKISLCAVNVQNKFSIFENECDMKISNCLNPGLDWQPLSMEECKNSLYGFYKKMDKFFTQYEP